MFADSLLGQATQRLFGRVEDSRTAARIEGVLVTVESSQSTVLTDADGRFVVELDATGTDRLLMQHLAYATRSVDVSASTDDQLLVITLDPRVLAVEDLDVQIERRPLYLESEGYYERKRRGWGAFRDPSWIAATNVGFPQAERFVEYLKTTAATSRCRITPVYLDRRRIENDGELSLLRDMSSDDVGAVEIYSNGHGVPLFALNDTTLSCGAVIMWSKQWEETLELLPELLIELCDPDPKQGPWLEGFVSDRLTDVALPGATIEVWQRTGTDSLVQTVRSDREGRFRVCGLATKESYDLQGSYAGRSGDPLTVEASDGGRTDLNVEVRVAVAGRIRGRIRDAETRRPVGAARVTALNGRFQATADPRGEFLLPGLPPGDHRLTISSDGYEETHEIVHVTSEETSSVVIDIARGR
ncbi:MAG: carboxypeptidase regulatory-like domain-containing protein [Gemmatimonadetes bacterium]|nr:carboxypeptidase regulatory-like domain-containing protein [Gemmatimonadota bacterium]